VIRNRTSRLSAELTQGQRLQQAALAARAELARSRDNLAVRQRTYAALEQKAVSQALASQGQALGTSDVALAAGENVERLRGEQANSQSISAVAAQLANGDPTPFSPFAPEGASAAPPFLYQLPVAAAVTNGLASVNASGVRSRGLALATPRGAAVAAPADGIVRFAGPFHDYDGVLIIEHAGGWLSLIVNVASELHAGDKVRLGDPVGRALGPIEVELSRNGRRISPALIAGSSQSLSKGSKGG
jgi:septal ring factor EnvC (AmiA/AmiB activator)